MLMRIAYGALAGVGMVLLLACLLASGPVFAADAVPMATQPAVVPVDWGAQMQGYIRTGLDALIAAGLAVGLAWLKRKTGIDVEARHREAIQTAAENAAGLLVAQGMAGAATIGSAAMRRATDYVEGAVPDAVRHFGLTAETIEPRILAKLGRLDSIRGA